MKNLFRATLMMAAVIMLTVSITPFVKGEVIQNERTYVDGFVMFNPNANGGAGEDVLISGVSHLVISSTVNDNVVTYKFHTNCQYVGIGQITGDIYQAPGGDNMHYSYQVPLGQPFELSEVFSYRLISHGSGENLVFHVVAHITINTNGEVIVYFSK
ncbi:MAG: hypothetical protein JXR49_17795 [Acidobacteria bacterium]|nr:hypothetical protein [Acidobacteriota bacterium]